MIRFLHRAGLGLACLALLVVLCTAPQPAAAQQPVPTGPDPAIGALRDAVNQEWRTPPVLPPQPGPVGLRPTAAQAPANYFDYVRMLYQAEVDHNSEIYIAALDGSPAIRLTNNPANDGRARLSRGGAAVVFTSDRDGDFEIFRMARDGSDLRQLTANPAVDAQPAWSYDGQYIAYISNLAGGFDLYTMKADGSAQTRIVTVAGGNIYSPAWLSGGTQLAYVFEPAGQPEKRRLFLVNADGSNPHALDAVEYPYLQHLVVKDNNLPIVYFDYVDASGRSRIYSHSLQDNTQAYPVQVGKPYNPNEDLWMGSYSPDNIHCGSLAYTAVSYAQVNQQWQISGMSVYFDCDWLRLDLPAGAPVALPDWQLIDTAAPVTRLQPFPEYTRLGYFEARWQQLSPGPAAITQYEYSRKEGDAANWVSYWQEGNATQAWLNCYYCEGGSTYSFKVRGKDEAGNIEPEITDPTNIGHTTFFTYQLNGRATDNRGKPLAGLALTLSPGAILPITTATDGGFSAHLTRQNAHTLGAAALPGLVLPTAQPFVTTDTTQNLFFGADDNRLQNGDFETIPGPEWKISGDLPAGARPQSAYTGAQGFSLGCATPLCAQPEYTPAFGETAVLAADAAGGVHILAQNYRDAIYVSSRSAQGIWSGKVAVFETGEAARELYLQVDAQGRLHAMARFENLLLYASKPAGGIWSAAQTFQTETYTHYAGSGLRGFAVSPTGQAYTTMRRMTADLQTHQDLVMLAQDGSGRLLAVAETAIGRAALAFAPDGTLHLVSGPFHQTISPQGVSGPQERVGNLLDEGLTPLRLFFDAGGLHVIYDSIETLHYLLRPDGSWSHAEKLPKEYSGNVVSNGDALHYIYSSYSNQNQSMVMAYQPGRGWTAPVMLESVRMSAASRPAGGALLLQRNGSDPYTLFELYDLERSPAGNTAVLEQTVLLDAALHAPTLSFAARFQSRHSSYSVAVAAGESITPLASVTAAHPWQQQWYSLEPWAGQTITLRITLQQAPGEPPARLDLDDLSLGSYRTPTLTAVTPNRVGLVSATPVLTILGENFMTTPNVWIDGALLPAASVRRLDAAHLEITLPVDLKTGNHTVALANPGSFTLTLPAAFTSGASTYLPYLKRP